MALRLVLGGAIEERETAQGPRRVLKTTPEEKEEPTSSKDDIWGSHFCPGAGWETFNHLKEKGKRPQGEHYEHESLSDSEKVKKGRAVARRNLGTD